MNDQRLVLIVIFLSFFANVCCGQTVELVSRGGKFELLRDGKPYSIKGVGGTNHLGKLAAAGGNSVRTWSTEGLGDLLDRAHDHGLTVCVGMWLGHERHGFDYQDESAVSGQYSKCLDAVRKYKDHPAVLLWAIGNEMEGEGNNPAIWYAINHIARDIKAIDPNHPTMTVIAELGGGENKIRNISKYCPDIDIIGVNSYGGIGSIGERYRRAGVNKPYIVTEHGPFGPWEVGKTAWESPIEKTSTEKARNYASGFQNAILNQRGLALGSYAFMWGNKQETSATWFGMLLPDGSRLGAVDAMTEQWTGEPPVNRCPEIANLKLEGAQKLKPGQKVAASVSASDPEGDALEIKWVLRSDAGTIGAGGDWQAEESAFDDAVNSNGSKVEVVAPASGGGYRLFAYVRDGKGGAAVANVPLFVEAPIKSVNAPKAQFPFVVYGDGTEPPYAPSGYMGNATAIVMEHDSTENPKIGKTCLKVEYNATDSWAGVLWQSPPNDWEGKEPGGFNLSGAEALEFYVRGDEGGEVVSFALGVVQNENPYADTGKAELKDVKLTKAWQKMRMPLNGLDLSRIKTGFSWSLPGQGKPVKFYLDDIRYVSESSSNMSTPK